MRRRYHAKVAIVTGGGRGIGLATAEKLYKEADYRVIIADVSFGESLSFLEGVRCDVGLEDDVRRLFEHCRKYGRLDLLFNCAGVHTSVRVGEASVDDFGRIYRTNILGTFLCTREALRLMETGVILNMGSSVGIVADKDAPLYSASKAWVIHFTKCLALEYGKRIRCNAICPGPVDTKMLRDAIGNDPGVFKSYEAMNPVGRIAKPEEIADLVLFIASGKASFVNGATLQIDGGESIFYGGEPPK